MANVFNSLLMVVLLAVVLLGVAAPAVTVLGVHPATPMLIAAYVYGMRLARGVQNDRMWEPRETVGLATLAFLT